MKSLICKIIEKFPNNWENHLPEGVLFKKEDTLAIFNYDIKADFSNPVIQEARGIIIDTETAEVVCWPFRKFGNYGESYADSIDWSTAVIWEKVDGSIIKAWFDKRKDEWRFSTNGMITPDANFSYLIAQAAEASHLDTSRMNKDLTYIFELVGPENCIIIRYPSPKLYHTGTRRNSDGAEFFPMDTYIGIEHPALHKCSSPTLEKCIDIASHLNDASQSVDYEGFVVCDANFNRIKIKSPEYIAVHSLAFNFNALSLEHRIDLIRSEALTALPGFDDTQNSPFYIESKEAWENIVSIFDLQKRIAETSNIEDFPTRVLLNGTSGLKTPPQATLTLMVGVPGSGKSFMAKMAAESANAVVLSSDKIREVMFGDASIQDNPKAVFETLDEATKLALSLGVSVFYDATNTSHRTHLINKIREACPNVCINCMVMQTPLEECLRRNASRDRVVPEEVIERMFAALQSNPPSIEEGFDAIHYVGGDEIYHAEEESEHDR